MVKLCNLNILLVEDHQDTVSVFTRLLNKSGLSADVATSLMQALEKAQQTKYHLLLSDLELPDGSGLALPKVLREKNSAVRAVAISGNTQLSDREAAASAGFDQFFAKPVNWTKLEQTILELLLQASQEVEMKENS